MAENLRTQTTQGVIWSAVERFSVQGVQFVIGIVMARLLSPNDYGLIGMLAIFMSISQVFIDGGFSTALVQKKNRTNADLSTVFFINFGISIILYGCLYLSAPYIAYFYEQPLLEQITKVYGLNLIINALAAVHKTILLIKVDFKTQSVISLLSAIISGAVGIYFAYNGYAVWALVIQAIVGALLNVILCYALVRWIPRLTFSIESFRSLFFFGSKVLCATIISEVYNNLYSLVIGKKYSSADLGYYTRANQFTSLLSQNISGVLARVSLPVLTNIQDDDERLINAYRKYIKCATFIVFPLILGLCGISKPLVLLLLTDKWSNAIILMQILCFNYLWNPITSVNLNLLYVKGRSDLILKLEIIKKSIAFTILVVSLFFSLEVVCLGLAFYSIIATILNCHYTDKLLNYGFIKQMRDVLPALLLSLIVLVISLILSECVRYYLCSILLSIVISGAIYIAASAIFKIEPYIEIKSIILGYVKRK